LFCKHYQYTAANAINAATKVQEANAGKPRQYWLYSFVLVLTTGFGGGFIAPVLLGRPAYPLSNELPITLCVVAWFFIVNLGLEGFFLWLPTKLVWSVILGLFRTHAVCNIVRVANEVLGSSVGGVPIVGPIVAGTILGNARDFIFINC